MASEPAALIDPRAAAGRASGLRHKKPLLVACDFDGTLSPLVSDPWGARIIPGAQRALRRLAASAGVDVALISGRTVPDLAARARIGGASYRGDHGAERAEAVRGFRPVALVVEREATSETVVRLVAALVEAMPRAVPEPWLVIEDKIGTVTFHFRAAPDLTSARARILGTIDDMDPGETLQRSGSSRAIELRPPGASTKGTALRHLIEQRRPRAVVMIGDDRNDALAFDVLRTARSSGTLVGLAIAVQGHADVTADVAPRADLMLGGPAQVARFLAALATLAQRTDD